HRGSDLGCETVHVARKPLREIANTNAFSQANRNPAEAGTATRGPIRSTFSTFSRCVAYGTPSTGLRRIEVLAGVHGNQKIDATEAIQDGLDRVRRQQGANPVPERAAGVAEHRPERGDRGALRAGREQLELLAD